MIQVKIFSILVYHCDLAATQAYKETVVHHLMGAASNSAISILLVTLHLKISAIRIALFNSEINQSDTSKISALSLLDTDSGIF